MKIIVFNVAARTSGALTILKEYYEKAKKDKKNKWEFVVSTPYFEETDNIKVKRYPWIKNSWIHRIFFDFFIARKVVDDFKADEVLSLGNIVVPGVNVKQTVYLHQSIPFTNYKFNFFKDPILWFYQNIYFILICNSMKKADKVIVQTKWMKNGVIEKCKINEEKISVIPPDCYMEDITCNDSNNYGSKIFIYPATPLKYKNHITILKAMKILKNKGISNYKVIFTFLGNENKLSKKLFKYAKKNQLPVDFVGGRPRKEVLKLYKKSVLIFSSYIETFGLPLLEANKMKCDIIASDTAFAHEILDGYDKVSFFDPFNNERLANIIKSKI